MIPWEGISYRNPNDDDHSPYEWKKTKIWMECPEKNREKNIDIPSEEEDHRVPEKERYIFSKMLMKELGIAPKMESFCVVNGT
jgi:hypothetical protein